VKQKKQMFEDSLNATLAAIKEGFVIGGGGALLRASRSTSLTLSGDEGVGAQILLKACEAPFRQIISNAGLDSSILLDEVVAAEPHFGFNALSEKVEDLLKSGVVDPAKVVRNGLRFAVSTAGVVLLSEVLIGNAPEEEEEGK